MVEVVTPQILRTLFYSKNFFTNTCKEQMKTANTVIQDFSKKGGGGNHLAPPICQETVPITNVLTARIHLWKNSRCF